MGDRVGVRVAARRVTSGCSDVLGLLSVHPVRATRTKWLAQLKIEATREAGTSFRDLKVWIRAYLRADIALQRANHFVLVDGVIPDA